MSALIEKVLNAYLIEVNGQRSFALHTSAFFFVDKKNIFQLNLLHIKIDTRYRQIEVS